MCNLKGENYMIGDVMSFKMSGNASGLGINTQKYFISYYFFFFSKQICKYSGGL